MNTVFDTTLIDSATINSVIHYLIKSVVYIERPKYDNMIPCMEGFSPLSCGSIYKPVDYEFVNWTLSDGEKRYYDKIAIQYTEPLFKVLRNFTMTELLLVISLLERMCSKNNFRLTKENFFLTIIILWNTVYRTISTDGKDYCAKFIKHFNIPIQVFLNSEQFVIEALDYNINVSEGDLHASAQLVKYMNKYLLKSFSPITSVNVVSHVESTSANTDVVSHVESTDEIQLVSSSANTDSNTDVNTEVAHLMVDNKAVGSVFKLLPKPVVTSVFTSSVKSSVKSLSPSAVPSVFTSSVKSSAVPSVFTSSVKSSAVPSVFTSSVKSSAISSSVFVPKASKPSTQIFTENPVCPVVKSTKVFAGIFIETTVEYSHKSGHADVHTSMCNSHADMHADVHADVHADAHTISNSQMQSKCSYANSYTNDYYEYLDEEAEKRLHIEYLL